MVFQYNPHTCYYHHLAHHIHPGTDYFRLVHHIHQYRRCYHLHRFHIHLLQYLRHRLRHSHVHWKNSCHQHHHCLEPIHQEHHLNKIRFVYHHPSHHHHHQNNKYLPERIHYTLQHNHDNWNSSYHLHHHYLQPIHQGHKLYKMIVRCQHLIHQCHYRTSIFE